MPNPFSGLIHSRKFWLAVFDAVLALLNIWVGRLFEPETQKLILQTFAALQPVFLSVIAAIAYEDGIAKKTEAEIIRERLWVEQVNDKAARE